MTRRRMQKAADVECTALMVSTNTSMSSVSTFESPYAWEEGLLCWTIINTAIKMVFLEPLLFLIEHIGNHIQSLPVSRHLPCARLFVVSNTRQRPGLPRSQRTHTANVRHTVYMAFAMCCTQQTPGTRRTQNLYREQHMAKTEHTAKANLTLTLTPSHRRLPCAAVRHTANNLSFF